MDGTLVRRLTIGLAAALALAAVAFAAIGFGSWWNTRHSDTYAYARTRDAVVLSARQDIRVLNTLDYRTLDAGLRTWLDASTGTLHDQLSQVSAADRKSITSARTTSVGKVLDAAVTQLDDRAGSATVIAAVEVTVTPTSGQAATKRNRFSATMTRVGGVWKLSDLQQVAVGLS